MKSTLILRAEDEDERLALLRAVLADSLFFAVSDHLEYLRQRIKYDESISGDARRAYRDASDKLYDELAAHGIDMEALFP